MALGERFRSGGARGIARFLSDHQHCDAGFDVHREAGAGSGRLLITCRGCGHSIAYNAAEAGELAAGPVLPNGGANGLDGEPDSDAGGPPPEAPQRRATARSLPAWLPPVLIAALVAAGLAMIVIGVLRSGGDDGQATAPESTQPAEVSTSSEVAPPAETEAPPETAPPAPTEQQAPQVRLKRRDFEGRFAIGVPSGWEAGRSADAISIEPGGGVAEIRVFYELGEESPSELAGGAARFLADEHEDAQVGKPKTVRLGQATVSRVVATYAGGEEVAVVLADGGYTFVILRRVDRGASESVSAEADASLASFRAK
jgi:hypothetical protein